MLRKIIVPRFCENIPCQELPFHRKFNGGPELNILLLSMKKHFGLPKVYRVKKLGVF